VKPIRYTEHGEARRVERGVSKEQVESAIRDRAIKLPDPKGREHVVGYPMGPNGRGLHVIYNEDAEYIWIVSVYWVGA
jgi:hypothetical protein